MSGKLTIDEIIEYIKDHLYKESPYFYKQVVPIQSEYDDDFNIETEKLRNKEIKKTPEKTSKEEELKSDIKITTSMKVSELRELAERLGVDTTYNDSGITKKKLKKQLYEDLVKISSKSFGKKI